MWIVNFYDYIDELNPSSFHTIQKLFELEKEARTYLNEEIYNRINNTIKDASKELLIKYFINDIKEYNKYIIKRLNDKTKKYYYKIKREFKNNFKELNKMYQLLCQGTYIIYDFTFNIADLNVE